MCSIMMQLYQLHNCLRFPYSQCFPQRWIFEGVTQLMCGGHVKHLFLLWDPSSVRAAFLMNDAASRG